MKNRHSPTRTDYSNKEILDAMHLQLKLDELKEVLSKSMMETILENQIEIMALLKKQSVGKSRQYVSWRFAERVKANTKESQLGDS